MIDAKMRPVSAILLSLMLILVQQSGGGSASPSWGDFTRGGCTTAGFRTHSATLKGATGDQQEALCKSTAAVVEGVYFVRPNKCTRRGGDMGGEFYVRDTTCDPEWGSFSDYGCKGNGIRRYSSVLWNIQGSWEDWCAVTPATVRGVFFPVPTRCYKYFFHEWGDFDIIDPCCPGGQHTELRSYVFQNLSKTDEALFAGQLPLSEIGSNQSNQALNLVRNGDSCENNKDRPPFPNQGRITSLFSAVQLLISEHHPFVIADYIFDRFFRVYFFPPLTTPQLIECYFCQQIDEIRFQAAPSGEDFAPLSALHIPTTPGALLVNSGGSFPANSYATIDVANPVANLLTTDQLSGCCLVFGWDNLRGRLHIGHAQPDYSILEISERVHIATYLRMNAGFEGVLSSDLRITFMGGDDIDWYGYCGDRANVVGFVYEEVIHILVQVVDANREPKKAWTFQFYRHS